MSDDWPCLHVSHFLAPTLAFATWHLMHCELQNLHVSHFLAFATWHLMHCELWREEGLNF